MPLPLPLLLRQALPTLFCLRHPPLGGASAQVLICPGLVCAFAARSRRVRSRLTCAMVTGRQEFS